MTTPAVKQPFWRTPRGWASTAVVLVGALLIGTRLLGEFTGGDVDATVTRCALAGARDRPSVTVALTVTNRGEVARDVAVEVEVSDPAGARLGEVTARVRGVGPGRTVEARESTVLGGPAAAVDCEVINVA